jgi:hypothetical protein
LLMMINKYCIKGAESVVGRYVIIRLIFVGQSWVN